MMARLRRAVPVTRLSVMRWVRMAPDIPVGGMGLSLGGSSLSGSSLWSPFVFCWASRRNAARLSSRERSVALVSLKPGVSRRVTLMRGLALTESGRVKV